MGSTGPDESADPLFEYDVEPEKTASDAVIEAVAIAKNVPIEDLQPLSAVLDPDALDALFAPRYDGTPRGGGEVVFQYAGFYVVIEDGTTVRVYPGEE